MGYDMENVGVSAVQRELWPTHPAVRRLGRIRKSVSVAESSLFCVMRASSKLSVPHCTCTFIY